MTRAALYARYSSDNQREASIEDQCRLCRDHARRERWETVGSYEDAAISGASTILRPGIQRLMRDAQHGEFNILLAEALDRISRDRRAQAQGDRKTLAKVEKAIAGIVAAIEDGMYQPSMKARMAEAPADIPDVHPNIANLYRLRVERFAEALDDPDGGRQAAAALRSLIGEIVLMPGDKRGEVHAELRGELMGILDFARAEEGGQPIPFMPAVEASPRNQN